MAHADHYDPRFRRDVHRVHRAGADVLVRLLRDVQRAHPASSASIADAVSHAASFPPGFLAQASRIVSRTDLVRLVDADE